MTNQEIGNLGEIYAAHFLRSNNYNIINNNFRTKYGEIDLITYDIQKNELVFVEVKTRTSNEYGFPEEVVSHIKKRKLLQTALIYVSKNIKQIQSWRIDLIAVKLNKNKKLEYIKHIKYIIDEFK